MRRITLHMHRYPTAATSPGLGSSSPGTKLTNIVTLHETRLATLSLGNQRHTNTATGWVSCLDSPNCKTPYCSTNRGPAGKVIKYETVAPAEISIFPVFLTPI
ncbi:hypothetical protein ACU8KH_06557 [Lachancea thermotolerans]